MSETNLKPYPVLEKKNPTAYDMLEFVIQLVKENKDRLWMRYWVAMINGKLEDLDTSLERPVPECGTVACLAGWVCLINGVTDGREIHSATAFKIMGLTEEDAAHWDLRSVFMNLDDEADEAIANLKQVMEWHETRLRQEITRV